MVLSLFLTLPFCILRPFNPKNNVIFFKILTFFMQVFAGIRVHVEGENIIKDNFPAVLVGNHQHNYDVFSVSKLFYGRTVVLGKFELGLIPVFGQIYALCGNILVKRGNRKKALKSMKIIEKKIIDDSLTILVFPEGHRNTGETLLPFKKGAYYTAVRTQSPLIPFSVSRFAHSTNFNMFKRVDIHVKVHPPIQTNGMTDKDISKLITESRTTIENGIESLKNTYGTPNK